MDKENNTHTEFRNENKRIFLLVFCGILIIGLLILSAFNTLKQIPINDPEEPTIVPTYKERTPKRIPEPMNIPDEWTLNGS